MTKSDKKATKDDKRETHPGKQQWLQQRFLDLFRNVRDPRSNVKMRSIGIN